MQTNIRANYPRVLHEPTQAAAEDPHKSGSKLEPVVLSEVQIGRVRLGHIPRHAGSGKQEGIQVMPRALTGEAHLETDVRCDDLDIRRPHRPDPPQFTRVHHVPGRRDPADHPLYRERPREPQAVSDTHHLPGPGPVPEPSRARADLSTEGTDFLAGFEKPVGGRDGLTDHGTLRGGEENNRRGDDSGYGHGLGDRGSAHRERRHSTDLPGVIATGALTLRAPPVRFRGWATRSGAFRGPNFNPLILGSFQPMTNPSSGIGRVIICFALLPTALVAQTGTMRIKDNLRATPNGAIVAVLEPGLSLTIAERQDDWIEVQIEGWVWMRSLQVAQSGSYDLVVSAAQGENLRARPSGGIVGRLGVGARLEEQERVPGWIRVRRRGWIWAESVEAESTTLGHQTDPSSASTDGASSAILAGPNGDTLAHMHPGTQLQVLARQGSWGRVRLEGWIWLPESELASDTVVARMDPAALLADPKGFRGLVVSWDLQFLSIERAERIRTDFFEGEPFLLTRHDGGGYVYVAFPEERLAEAGTLFPLERITVVGRVRSPASALTGSPILDMRDLIRDRR